MTGYHKAFKKAVARGSNTAAKDALKVVVAWNELSIEEAMLLEQIPTINDAFEKAVAAGIDPHTAVAEAIKCDRQRAKMINYARVYGCKEIPC